MRMDFKLLFPYEISACPSISSVAVTVAERSYLLLPHETDCGMEDGKTACYRIKGFDIIDAEGNVLPDNSNWDAVIRRIDSVDEICFDEDDRITEAEWSSISGYVAEGVFFLGDRKRGNNMNRIIIQKEKLNRFIQAYIDEMEQQEVIHIEIVELLLDFFSRNELEELGFIEYIDDYFQDSHLNK